MVPLMCDIVKLEFPSVSQFSSVKTFAEHFVKSFKVYIMTSFNSLNVLAYMYVKFLTLTFLMLAISEYISTCFQMPYLLYSNVCFQSILHIAFVCIYIVHFSILTQIRCLVNNLYLNFTAVYDLSKPNDIYSQFTPSGNALR